MKCRELSGIEDGVGNAMDRLDVLFQKTPLKGETPNPLRMFLWCFRS